MNGSSRRNTPKGKICGSAPRADKGCSWKTVFPCHGLWFGLAVGVFGGLSHLSCSKGTRWATDHPPICWNWVPGSTSITHRLRWLGSSLVVYITAAITVGFLSAAPALIGIPFTRDAGAQTPDAGAQPPQANQFVPQARSTLDPREVDALVKEGQRFVVAGDFVAARLVFQRAAEAGNAAAALALGASYDPVVLARLGVRNVDADASKARAWYQKAKELGASATSRTQHD